jgi:hypothetical protein
MISVQADDSMNQRKTDSYRHRDLRWDGHKLRLNSGRLLATVEPDTEWAGMHRVRLTDGELTDMVNLTRAKDAAAHLVLADLNKHAGRVEAPPVSHSKPAAISLPSSL